MPRRPVLAAKWAGDVYFDADRNHRACQVAASPAISECLGLQWQDVSFAEAETIWKPADGMGFTVRGVHPVFLCFGVFKRLGETLSCWKDKLLPGAQQKGLTLASNLRCAHAPHLWKRFYFYLL